jgi:hypothetical protein
MLNLTGYNLYTSSSEKTIKKKKKRKKERKKERKKDRKRKEKGKKGPTYLRRIQF